MKRALAAGLCLLLWSPFASAAPANDDDSAADAPEAETSLASLPSHRFAFVGAGGFAVLGFGFSYWAQGQAQRASSIESARDARAQLQAAQASAQAANVMYGLAAASLIYGLALELLPEPAAEKASLTFHF